jgi:two-component system sensor histidine kinase CreC
MRALTHELKSPLAAIGGAAELLHDELPAADRERFARQVDEQVQRLRAMVDRLLELSKLESLHAPEQAQDAARCRRWCRAARRWRDAGARLRCAGCRPTTTPVPATAERLAGPVQPAGQCDRLRARRAAAGAGGAAPQAARVRGQLRDHGPGVPDYALPRLGERFFSTPARATAPRAAAWAWPSCARWRAARR